MQFLHGWCTASHIAPNRQPTITAIMQSITIFLICFPNFMFPFPFLPIFAYLHTAALYLLWFLRLTLWSALWFPGQYKTCNPCIQKAYNLHKFHSENVLPAVSYFPNHWFVFQAAAYSYGISFVYLPSLFHNPASTMPQFSFFLRQIWFLHLR